MDIRELKEKRNTVVNEMRTLLATAEQEKRDLTEAESKKFDELKSEEKRLAQHEERAQYLADLERQRTTENRNRYSQYDTAVQEFSIVRAINNVLTNGQVDAGREREVSQEVAHRMGRQPQGIWVPHEVFKERRTMVTSSGSGAHLIPEMHRADMFIDVLREALVIKRAGATVIDGLQGSVDIPRQTTASTAHWVNPETTDVTESTPVYDSCELAPKTVGALNQFSRRMLISGNPAIENLVRRDLAATIAGAIDDEALNGTGTTMPDGLLTLGINTTAFSGAPTWAKVLEMVSLIGADNALMGSLSFMGNSYMQKELRTTLVTATYGDRMIMEAPNALAGYPFFVNNYLAGDPTASPAVAGTLVFGNWSDLLLGYWSGVDIVVNPYETNVFAKGAVLIIALQDCDVAVRHLASFCSGTAVTLS